MTADVETDELCTADVMSRCGFHLPVTDNERPVGVVGLVSVVSALRRDFPGW